MSASTLNCHQIVQKAHQRSEITRILVNPYAAKEFISIGHDGFIRVWNSDEVCIKRQYRFRTPYLTCLVPFKNGFLLGVGNGNLIRLSESFQVQSTMLLHDDCVTCVSTQGSSVITTGYDGRVCLLNKDTLALERCIELETPLSQMLVQQNILYLAGNPSYKINLSTNSIQKLCRYENFVSHQNEVLGYSDEKGITVISTNVCTYVPCQYMISVKNCLLFMAEGTLGVMKLNRVDEVTWQIFKIPFFKESYSILSGLVIGDQLFLAGECSNLYKFKTSQFYKGKPFEK